MKHAVIMTGGKQYRVAENDVIYVEKLNVADGHRDRQDHQDRKEQEDPCL